MTMFGVNAVSYFGKGLVFMCIFYLLIFLLLIDIFFDVDSTSTIGF